MIAGSFGGENTYQNTVFQDKWILTNLRRLQVFLRKHTCHVCEHTCHVFVEL